MNGNSWFDSTPYVGCCCRVDPDGAKASHPSQGNRGHLKGVSHARNQDSIRYNGAARRPGPGASGSSTGLCQRWCAAGLSIWLLRLCAIRLLALWLLRAGVLLQRHLPGHGPMGRMGLQQRLGRPSVHRGWWRKLSRRRRRGGQSQQLCTWRRWQRPSPWRRTTSQQQRDFSFRRSASQRRSCPSDAHQRTALIPGPSFARSS